jgi:hypothetical protein
MSDRAGRNAGWWTPENERWFLTRLRAIRDGNEQPYTASRWLDILKGQKIASKLKRNTGRAAEDVLKANIGKLLHTLCMIDVLSQTLGHTAYPMT